MAIQTINVANASELSNALANATGGETILLGAGDYGRLDLKGSQYASTVTIKSADSSSMASFSQAYLDHSSNITFDAIKFDYTYSSGDQHFTSKFQVQNSSGITFTGSIFDGDIANGAGTGKGLVVRGSTNVDVIGTEFHTWWKGVNVSISSDVNLIGNDIHTIRSDGITLDAIQTALLENNYIHDFGALAGSGDHRDMIQIKRSNGDGSSDITIRDNILDMGTGDYTQGIWAGGDRANPSDPTNWNQNIVVEGNVIYNAHTNGIALHMTDGLIIKENTLLAVPGATTGGVSIPKIIVSSNSKNVSIEQNVTSRITGDNGQADWNVQNNALVQNSDSNAPGYYDNEFVYHATAQADGYNQFQITVGSMVDQLNAGSSLSDLPPFSYDAWVNSPSSGVSQPGPTGSTGISPPNTSGDAGIGGVPSADTNITEAGVADTATNNSVTQVPETAVTSEIATADSEPVAPVPSETDQIETDQPEVADGLIEVTEGEGDAQKGMTFDDFVLDIANLSKNGQAQLKDDATIVDGAADAAIQFDGHRDKVELGRLVQFESSDQIAFKVEFARAEADGSSQRLVWNHQKIGLTLTDDGLIAHVRNNDDPFHKGFRVDNLGLNDTDAHQISMMVDQASDRLQVLVDGNLVLDETTTDFDFVGTSGHEWGWSLGTGWGRHVDGEVSGFAIDDDVSFVDQPVVHDDLFA